MSQRVYSGDGGGNAGHGGDGTGTQLYFCYECNRTVSISPSLTELVCPNCNGGFLEEYENPNPNSVPPNPFLPFDDSSPFGFPAFSFTTSRSGTGTGTGTGYGSGDPMDLSALFGGRPMSRPVGGQNSGEFNPFAFLQNYLTTLRDGGANIQFVIENDSGGGGGGGGGDLHPSAFREFGNFGIPSNLGDYFIGPGLEQLIQQLAENDPNRYGTPPASKSAIEKLPDVKISKEIMESDYSDCAVCKDSFDLDEEAKQLPCKHMYHSECILPWLELHNSCPVCRFELPTDDQEYENRSREGGSRGSGGSVAGSGGGSQENPPTPRTLERRFRINLPWPFAGYNTSAETSNSGAQNNSSGDGNQGSGGSGGGGGGQARQEDLD